MGWAGGAATGSAQGSVHSGEALGPYLASLGVLKGAFVLLIHINLCRNSFSPHGRHMSVKVGELMMFCAALLQV